MKSSLLRILGLTLALVSSTQAAIITFEGHPDDLANVQTQDGFQFVFSAAGWGIITNGFSLPLAVQNGTTRLVARGNSSGSNAQVTMSPVGGGVFSLTGFDAATLQTNLGNGGIQITGNLFGGGTVSTTITTSTTFASFVLPSNFMNLTSVVFQDTFSGPSGTVPGLALDNLNVNASATPDGGATVAMLGLAVLGLAALRRRVA